MVGAAAILVVTAVAVPALLRSLRAGEWRRLRGGAAIAGGLGAAWLGLSAAVVVRAHQLSPTQRYGGSHSFGAMAYGWGTLTVLTIAAWTALAIRAERQLRPSELILRLQASAAVVVTAATGVVTAAMLAWWGSIASSAPWFLQGIVTPAGQPPATTVNVSTVNGRLVLTALAMVVATAIAIAGTVRIAWQHPPAPA